MSHAATRAASFRQVNGELLGLTLGYQLLRARAKQLPRPLHTCPVAHKIRSEMSRRTTDHFCQTSITSVGAQQMWVLNITDDVDSPSQEVAVQGVRDRITEAIELNDRRKDVETPSHGIRLRSRRVTKGIMPLSGWSSPFACSRSSCGYVFNARRTTFSLSGKTLAHNVGEIESTHAGLTHHVLLLLRRGRGSRSIALVRRVEGRSSRRVIAASHLSGVFISFVVPGCRRSSLATRSQPAPSWLSTACSMPRGRCSASGTLTRTSTRAARLLASSSIHGGLTHSRGHARSNAFVRPV